MPHTKIRAFEYVLFQLKEWYKDANSITDDDSFNRSNDLSILKVIKLNFFISANEEQLLSTFNNFYAMPLGHVESDVYNHVKLHSGDLTEFIITPSRTEVKEDFLNMLSVHTYSNLNSSVRHSIDNSISSLRKENDDLINYSGFQLVELSHLWFSWKRMFSLAKSLSLNSRKISSDLIRNEQKIFSIGAYN